MRIIAGGLGGRTFESPHGHRTHPMSEKMRGAIFNALGDIAGLKVLDAYAGSGALGLEAISHGAASVTALDNDKAAYLTIQKNIQALGLSQTMQVHCMNVKTWVLDHATRRFDIIFADPPYDAVRPDVLALVGTLLAPDGILVVSLPPSAGYIPLSPEVQLVSHKSYNDAQLWFYRR